MTKKLNRDELMRKALFEPCKSMDELHKWIKVFLDIDLPDCIVYDTDIHNPPSNSSPMHLLWEMYEKALDGTDEKFQEVLAYAARGSFKTLSSSIFEILCLFHLGRSVAHMAAIEPQAQKCLEYVGKALKRPYLRDYVSSNNKRTIKITKFWHPDTQINHTPREWETFVDLDYKSKCIEQTLYIKVVIATMAGSNSEHVPFLCVDGNTQISVFKDNSVQSLSIREVFGELDLVDGDFSTSVNNYPIQIPSFNHKNGSVELSNIIQLHRKKSKTVKLNFTNKKYLICTPDHPVLTVNRGYVKAAELTLDDKIVFNKTKLKLSPPLDLSPLKDISFVESKTDDFDQVVLGSLLGDCGIYKNSKGNGTPYLREQHAIEQSNYLEWKKSLISQKLRTIDTKNARSGYTGAKQVGFYTGHSPVLNEYFEFKKTLNGVERLSALGLAVWYMDDGCEGRVFRLSSESFTKDQNQYLKIVLKNNFDIDVDVSSYTRNDKTYFYLSGGCLAKKRLAEICKPYIHVDMAYKFDISRHFKKCTVCDNEFFHFRIGRPGACEKAICRFLSVNRQNFAISKLENLIEGEEKDVYDFTLDKNHNFFGNSVLLHQCLDELDLAPEKPVEEAMMIPDQTADGKLAITFMTSSRKFSFGPVQKAIDDAATRGLNVRHWNLIDVTEACPKSRHLPQFGKIPIYYNLKTLTHATEEEYKEMSPDVQKDFYLGEGYRGCVERCSLFPMCKSYLSTKQKSTSPLLKSIQQTTGAFKKVSVDTALAQLMCFKPSSEGLVYPHFNRDIHMLTPAKMAEEITGFAPKGRYTKNDLINLMLARKMEFHMGMDFGFTHNFACVLGALDGHRLFIIDVLSVAGLELTEKLEICEGRYRKFNPTIYPDPAYPSDIKSFRKKGWRCRNFTKDVLVGIDSVRIKLLPGQGRAPELFLLAGEDGCELLAKDFSVYHWVLDAAENPTDVPTDKDDDRLDSLRYLCQNLFGPRGKLTPGLHDRLEETSQTPAQQAANDLMREEIRRATGGQTIDKPKSGKRGGFIFSI